MIPTALDHLFVFVVLVIVFPFVGWWAYQRFLARYQREGERALVREYRITILWLIGLGAATFLVWLASGRRVAVLGFTPLRLAEENSLAVGGTIGVLASAAIRPIVAALVPKARAGLKKQYGELTAFLPKTGEQLAWGLAVSVAAGLFEEIAYRGYLIPYFQYWLPNWGGVAAAAILFGLAHLYQGKLGIIMTALLGGLFGYMFVATGSLFLPILLHTCVDISAMLTAYLVLKRQ